MARPARNHLVGESRSARDAFARRGWTPFSFQHQCWDAQAGGASGLVHVATGTGKTLSVWMGALEADRHLRASPEGAAPAGSSHAKVPRAIKVLWLTPMRALAGDTLKSLREGAEMAGVPWDIQARTGDTSSSLRARLRREDGQPDALVTTPESLSVMLSYADTGARLKHLRLVVVDEWHELLGTKRGVQTELCLARLRSLAPGLMTWGLSATLGNVDHALRVLVGERGGGVLIRGHEDKAYEVETILPREMERFPWAGHIGLRLLPEVLARVEAAGTTLVFCNTRGQAEIWHQAIVRARPQWLEGDGAVAIHHGSLDRDLRGRVEARLKDGTLRCVVCTSSLDLGVDFPPVDQVIQIGSAKGVGRFMQRAGRSGHQPGRASRLVCVPTNAWELVEFAAARRAIAGRAVEAREGLRLSLDVLCQHLLTLGVGEGFAANGVLEEVRATHAFADITPEQFQWALDFASRGGGALRAYTRFTRLEEVEGRWKAVSPGIARLHRLGIGTITSDQALTVKFKSGQALGSIEEGFVSKMRPGTHFVFAGRTLEFLGLHQMSVFVRPGKKRSGLVVSYPGGRMPLSHELAQVMRRVLAEHEVDALAGRAPRDPEIACAEPVLNVQRAWSQVPGPGELLIERCTTREGHHAYLYPLEGRLVHEGLAHLLAFRLARRAPATVTMSANDLGLELVSNTPMALDEAAWREMLSVERLTEDLLECLNASELARRQFREIARIAGLLIPALPGRGGPGRSSKQAQASSELFFDVFSEFDPGNLLLDQARREVLERQLQVERLRATLTALGSARLTLVDLPDLSPLAFPLWADRLRGQLTSEQWEDRVKKMLLRLEDEASGASFGPGETPESGVGGPGGPEPHIKPKGGSGGKPGTRATRLLKGVVRRRGGWRV